MIDDTTLNKSAIIYGCLKRIADEVQGDFKRRKILRFKIPSFLICFVLAERRLGIPQSSRETFDLFYRNSLTSKKSAITMKHMFGFRDVAVLSYEKLQQPILEAIVEHHLRDFEVLIKELSL
jgi:hypothetical protein